MLLFMLDTNLCIRVIKDRSPTLKEKFLQEYGRMSISAVTYAELKHGVEYSDFPEKNLLALEKFAGRVKILDFGEQAANHFGQIRADLRRKNNSIGVMDTMIAGHARGLDLIMVTGNLSEFQRVEGLRTEDWL